MKKAQSNNLNGINFRPVIPNQTEFYSACMQIYQNSFPANERHPEDAILRRIEMGSTQMYAGSKDGQILCMAILWDFKENDKFVLLDYIAVGKDFRGMHIGSSFLHYLAALIHTQGKLMLMEVEDPNYGENKLEKIKRVHYYLNNKASILKGVNYYLPALDNTNPTEMILMLLGAQEEELSGQLVKSIIEELYIKLYQKPKSDPLLNSFLHLVPERVSLTNIL
jgi:hypothetical protein